MDPFRKYLQSWLVVALSLFSTLGRAEPQYRLNEEIPFMSIRGCSSLEGIRKEANLAYQNAKATPPSPTEIIKERTESCGSVYGKVTPLREEMSVNPFEAWSLVHDEDGPDAIEAPELLDSQPIKVSMRIQGMRVIIARLEYLGGKWHTAWVLLADSPYSLAYVKARKRSGK